MIVQWLAYVAVRMITCIIQALPIEACETLSIAIAHLAHDVLRIRRATIDENLSHAFPQQTPAQRRQLALAMWSHLFLMTCELMQVPRKLRDTNWRQHVELSDRDTEQLLTKLLSDRPTIIVSGHFGNFEVGGITSGLLGFPTYTVARPLDNVFLHRFVTRFREATGQYMLPKQGSAKQLDAILRSGGTMILLGDQSAGPKGCWVDFFGRPASCHKAVALFSLVNRAPLLLTSTVRTRPMHFRIGVSAVFDPLTDEIAGVKPLTQWYSHHLERAVRHYPEQYWWLHNRWKKKPARPRRRVRVDRPASQPRPKAPCDIEAHERTT